VCGNLCGSPRRARQPSREMALIARLRHGEPAPNLAQSRFDQPPWSFAGSRRYREGGIKI